MPRQEDLVRVLSHPGYWAIKCCCITPLLIISLTLFTLINFDPSCSIHTLYVPALNKYLNSSTISFTTDSLIFFDLELENTYRKSLRYDAMELTFYSEANKSMPIGNYTVPGFIQGEEKKAQRRDVVVATGSVPWQEAAIKALSSGAKAGFRVDLATKVKFKNFFWYSSKKKIEVGGKVEVDDSGMKVGKTTVKLVKSGTPPLRAGLLVVICLLVSAYFS